MAERGRGAWLNGRRIHVTHTRDMARCVLSLWHEAGLWRDRPMRERVARLGAEVRSVTMVGACFSLAYVAAGRLDGYWERQAHPWDVAAGALLVREAGGRVTGGAGQPFDVDEATIVASNGRIHDRMVALLNGRRPLERDDSPGSRPLRRVGVDLRRRAAPGDLGRVAAAGFDGVELPGEPDRWPPGGAPTLARAITGSRRSR